MYIETFDTEKISKAQDRWSSLSQTDLRAVGNERHVFRRAPLAVHVEFNTRQLHRLIGHGMDRDLRALERLNVSLLLHRLRWQLRVRRVQHRRVDHRPPVVHRPLVAEAVEAELAVVRAHAARTHPAEGQVGVRDVEQRAVDPVFDVGVAFVVPLQHERDRTARAEPSGP